MGLGRLISSLLFSPGTKGGAQQTDEFGNYTQIDWSVPSLPSPSLEIDVTTNSAYTSDWLVGWDTSPSLLMTQAMGLVGITARL